jgi:tight adherence protein B
MNLGDLRAEVGMAAFKATGIVLAGVSVGLLVWSIAGNPDSLPRRYWARYVASLESKLHDMFIQQSGTPIAVGQVAVAVVVLAVQFTVGLPYWYALLALTAMGPKLYIEQLRRTRLQRMETQVEPFFLALANALKTTPSIGSALSVVHQLQAPPIQDEIGLVLKEVRVGTTLDQALLNMSARVSIPELEAGLASVLIGRQVGGKLPEILEGTAGTLREMIRLTGVVRTKTASGRSQLVTLAMAPLVVVGAFEWADPGFFTPLTASALGMTLATISALCWIVALALARQIMAVDI